MKVAFKWLQFKKKVVFHHSADFTTKPNLHIGIHFTNEFYVENDWLPMPVFN